MGKNGSCTEVSKNHVMCYINNILCRGHNNETDESREGRESRVEEDCGKYYEGKLLIFLFSECKTNHVAAGEACTDVLPEAGQLQGKEGEGHQGESF